MTVRATDVFTPGAFPRYTYVERGAERLEATLADALSTPGQLVSLAGPSKSGKTVLVEKVVGRDLLIPISGASIHRIEDVWDRVFDWMGTPDTISKTTTMGATAGVDATAKGSIGVPMVTKGEAGVTGHVAGSVGSATQTVRERRGLGQIVAEIGKSDFVVLLDDFHYMPAELQGEVAKVLKEAVRLEVKIITAVVTHRGDDVVRANPELRGRVHAIDVNYWQKEQLAEIATSGFSALNAYVDPATVARFVEECAGSPQLMQSLCLQICFAFNLRIKHEGSIPTVIALDEAAIRRILEQTSAMTDFRSLGGIDI
jgi:hypothetical protein